MPPRLRGVTSDELLRRGLKFSQLRLIATLGRLGQIGAAAERLGMTQPGASRLLAQLEAIVQTPLYIRHARGVTLTEAGRILAERATRILGDLDISASEISQLTGGLRGTVRVGAVTGPALDLLLPAIRAARTAYPDVDFAVSVETSDMLARLLQRDELDFYIGRLPDGGEAQPFTFTPIGTESISLVVRPGHPLLDRPAITLADCLAHDWVTQPPGSLLRRTVEEYLLAEGHPLPARVVSTHSTLFTLALVNGTDAIAPVAAAVARFFTGHGGRDGQLAVLPVSPELTVKTFGLVRLAEAELNPPATRFLERLASLARPG